MKFFGKPLNKGALGSCLKLLWTEILVAQKKEKSALQSITNKTMLDIIHRGL